MQCKAMISIRDEHGQLQRCVRGTLPGNEYCYQHKSQGAGGGQAGDLAVGSLKDDTRREPLPVDAPGPIVGSSPSDRGDSSSPASGGAGNTKCPALATDTHADLQRYFCGPYCPKCGWVEGEPLHRSPDLCQHGEPGLHTRCPETRVEGLEYVSQVEAWCLKPREIASGNMVGRPMTHPLIENAHAADLLVQGVVKAVWRIEITNIGSEWSVDLVATSTDGFVRVNALTLPEAVAIAYHRMLDAEEQG